eukprot:scaffold457_cov117-Skeletonema_dohrnii-CCMP3373.AAC.14
MTANLTQQVAELAERGAKKEETEVTSNPTNLADQDVQSKSQEAKLIQQMLQLSHVHEAVGTEHESREDIRIRLEQQLDSSAAEALKDELQMEESSECNSGDEDIDPFNAVELALEEYSVTFATDSPDFELDMSSGLTEHNVTENEVSREIVDSD